MWIIVRLRKLFLESWNSDDIPGGVAGGREILKSDFGCSKKLFAIFKRLSSLPHHGTITISRIALRRKGKFFLRTIFAILLLQAIGGKEKNGHCNFSFRSVLPINNIISFRRVQNDVLTNFSCHVRRILIFYFAFAIASAKTANESSAFPENVTSPPQKHAKEEEEIGKAPRDSMS